jgi:hypothetical protein
LAPSRTFNAWNKSHAEMMDKSSMYEKSMPVKDMVNNIERAKTDIGLAGGENVSRQAEGNRELSSLEALSFAFRRCLEIRQARCVLQH